MASCIPSSVPRLAWRVLAIAVLAGMALAPVQARADQGEPEHVYDEDNALDIMELCAGCHGEYGQGGSEGEYPRLAGMPVKYLVKQMHAFQDGTRESMAMAPYADEREMPEQDLMDISIYLAGIELPSRMPKIDPDLDSYEKLLIASRVLNVPRIEGDMERGEALYNGQCKKCHGTTGTGRGSVPGLIGQYSEYLRLQMDYFMTGERINKPMDKYLKSLTADDVEALLAYLSIADD